MNINSARNIFSLIASLPLILACGKDPSENTAPSMKGDARTPLTARLRNESVSGVDAASVKSALSGNADSALNLAISLSDQRNYDGAIFWYQVAVENGSKIAMQHLSVLLRSTDCIRANFFLRKYLDSLDSIKNATEYNETSRVLSIHEAECERLSAL